jgi:hypothetical protein
MTKAPPAFSQEALFIEMQSAPPHSLANGGWRVERGLFEDCGGKSHIISKRQVFSVTFSIP